MRRSVLAYTGPFTSVLRNGLMTKTRWRGPSVVNKGCCDHFSWDRSIGGRI